MSLATFAALRRDLDALRATADPPWSACDVVSRLGRVLAAGESIAPLIARAPNARVVAFLTGTAARYAAALALVEADELEDGDEPTDGDE